MTIEESNNNNIGSNNTMDCKSILLEHDNHVFIFTSSGKPVYTRYGTTNQIADLFALLLVFMNMSQEYDQENKCTNSCTSTCHTKENNYASKNIDIGKTNKLRKENLLTCTSMDINGHTITLFFYNAQHMYYVLSTSNSKTHASTAAPSECKSTNNKCWYLHQSCDVEDKTRVFIQPQWLLRQLHRFVLSLVPNINDILSSSPSFDVQRLFSSNDERFLESIIASHEGVHGALSWSLLLPYSVFVAESIAIPLAMRKVLETATLSSCAEVLRENKSVKSSWVLSLLTSSLSSSSSTTSERLEQDPINSLFVNGENRTKSNKSRTNENSESSAATNTRAEGNMPCVNIEEAANHLFTYIVYGDALLTAVSTSSLSCDASVLASCTRNERKRSSVNHNFKNNTYNIEFRHNCNSIFASTHNYCASSLCNNELCQETSESCSSTSKAQCKRPKQSLPCVLSAEDTQLLFHFVRNVAQTVVREAWFPLCLPNFNESGFVWVYVADLIDMLTESININNNNAINSCDIGIEQHGVVEKLNLSWTPQTKYKNVDGNEQHDIIKPKRKLLLVQVTASSTSFNCCAYLASRVISKLIRKGKEWIRTLISTLNHTNKQKAGSITKEISEQLQKERSNSSINIDCDCMMHGANEQDDAEEKVKATTVNMNFEKENDAQNSLRRLVEEIECNKEEDIKSHDACLSLCASNNKSCKLCITDNTHYLSKVCQANLLYCAFVTNTHFTVNGSTSFLSVPCLIAQFVDRDNSKYNNTVFANTTSGNYDNEDKYLNFLINDFAKHEADLFSDAFTLIRETSFTYLQYKPTQKLMENLLNSFYTETEDTYITAINNNVNDNENSMSNKTRLYQQLQEHKTYKREFAYLCEKLIQTVFFVFTTCSSQQEMIRCSLEYMHHIVSDIDSVTVKQYFIH